MPCLRPRLQYPSDLSSHTLTERSCRRFRCRDGRCSREPRRFCHKQSLHCTQIHFYALPCETSRFQGRWCFALCACLSFASLFSSWRCSGLAFPCCSSAAWGFHRPAVLPLYPLRAFFRAPHGHGRSPYAAPSRTTGPALLQQHLHTSCCLLGPLHNFYSF